MKKFNGLLRSEIKKAEKLANKITGFADCKITGYSSNENKPFDFDDNCWVDCKCEICRNYEQPIDISIYLSIPMFDRRMSWAYCIIDGKLIR